MQVTETHTEGLKREYKVLINADDIGEKMTGKLQELGGRVKIPGFRPGKVPITILKQRFGKSVMGEVLQDAVQDSSTQAISERGLRPATQPKIEITSFDEGKDLEYTIALEVLPDFEPTDFSQLTVHRTVIDVEDTAIEETLADLSKAYKDTKPLETPRPAQSGDVLVVDFKGTVDGEAYPGMEAEGHHLELGSNSFIEGFEEQLIGVNADDTREVRVTFPEAYANDKLAGREAVFSVTVKEILVSSPAEIGDGLAQRLGEENLDALKAAIRERLASEYKDVTRSKLKRELLDQLAEAHDFAVPEGMVDAEFHAIWHQIEDDRKNDRLDPDDAAKSDEELKTEYRAIAERRVRLGLLISEVGRRNGIEVTQEELNRAMLREAQQYPGQERQIFEFFQKNPEALANLRAPIFENKVVDFIVDLAQVEEKRMTAEAFRAELEAESQDGEAADSGPKGKKAAGRTKAKKTGTAGASKKSGPEDEQSAG